MKKVIKNQFQNNVKVQFKLGVLLLLFNYVLPAYSQINTIAVGYHHAITESEISPKGLEFNSTNYLYNLGVGYYVGGDEESKLNKWVFNTDLHLIKFHHGYEAKRLVPYVGINAEIQNIRDLRPEFHREINLNVIDFKAGLKYSSDRFIVSTEYQIIEKSLNFKVAYAFYVTNKCVRKKIDERAFRRSLMF
jgi:hypothetical protein